MPDESDLFWQAYRFHAGEMTPTEADVFEQRLAEDLAACEALSKAVRVSEALAGSRKLSARVLPSRQKPFGRHRVAMIAGLVASVLLMVGLLRFSSSWLPTLENESAGLPTVGTLFVALPETVSVEETEDAGEELASTEMDVPDWLVMAVGDESAPINPPATDDEV